VRQLAIANSVELPWVVTLLPRADFARARRENPGVEISPQDGTPFAMRRELLFSPLGLPCNPPPWGTLAAVDLATGAIRWQIPFGTVRDIAPVPLPIPLGVPSLGGPLVTASGLVFIAAAMDDYLRAFDVETGEELWRARLPAGGQATPMTYRAETGGGPESARQFVVIAAGGHGRSETRLGDSIVAYALPD
jgi:quinoprotein glucose dehydrogenase